MSNLGVVYKIHADAKQAKAELASLGKTGTLVNKSLMATATVLNTSMKLAVASLAAMAAGAAGAYFSIKDLNENISMTAAITGMSADRMSSLTEEVLRVSAAFGVSNKEIAAGTTVLARAGLRGNQLEGSLEAIGAAARANGKTFEEMAQIGIFAVKAFHRDMSEMGELFDVMQTGANSAVMTITEFQEILQYSGQSAYLTGLSIEELSAMMATLANQGVKTGIGARGVNRMLLQMVETLDEDVVKMQAFTDAMGLTVEVIKDGQLNLTGIVKAFSELDLDIGVLQESMEMFSIRSVRAWLGLITGAEEYGNILGDIEGSTGAVNDLLETLAKTSLSFRLGQMKESFLAELYNEEYTSMLFRLFDKMESAIPKVAGMLRNMFNKQLGLLIENFDDIINAGLELISVVISMADNLAPFLKILTAWDGLFLKLMIYFKFLNFVHLPQFITSMSIGATAAARFAGALGSLGSIFLLIMMSESKTTAAIYAITGAVIALGIALAAAASIADFTVSTRMLGTAAIVGAGLGAAAYRYSELDTPSNDVAGYGGYGMESGYTGYARGTPNVPRDMLTVVHKGETILKRGDNSASGNNYYIDMSGAFVGEDMVRELRRLESKQREEDKDFVVMGGGL